jgi:hypothetical protein
MKELQETEELCNYCSCTDYGNEPGANRITWYSSGCEGTWCEEAYSYYLDNEEEEEDE